MDDKKIRRLYRLLSRKQKDSANREKAKHRLAVACEKDKNRREDFLNKLSLSIVKDYDLIAMENLDIKSMLKDKKNKNLHKSISELGWYSFMSKVKYKAEWYGKVFVQVENSFPSSQLCSHCGHQNKEVKNLNVREWECPNCGNKDHNKMNVTRRTCGYLGENFWNVGKTKEIKSTITGVRKWFLDKGTIKNKKSIVNIKKSI